MASGWRDFLLQLRERGRSGIEFVVSDNHAELQQAIVEVLPALRFGLTTKLGAGSQAGRAALWSLSSGRPAAGRVGALPARRPG